MEPRPPRIIAFAGSLRTDSNNKKLARAMAAGAELAGAEVRLLDLKDYPVPVLDADLFDAKNSDPHRLYDEGGRVGPPHDVPLPEGLLQLKEHVRWADGWLVATPEYGGSIPGMLKNLIDWLTGLRLARRRSTTSPTSSSPEPACASRATGTGPWQNSPV